VLGQDITTFDVLTPNLVISPPIVNDKIITYDDNYIFTGDRMAQERNWTTHVKGILKAELARRHVGYKELAERLEAIGVHDNERNIANKIARGSFTAVFFVQCMEAIGCHILRLNDPVD
jgi:hypothetical protein